MSTVELDHEVLATRTTEGNDFTSCVELSRNARGLRMVAARSPRGGSPLEGRFVRVLEAPTASLLEFNFERLCLEIALKSEAGVHAANELSRLFYEVMKTASRDVRMASRSTRSTNSTQWFDVAIVRWGERDFEIACRFVDTRPEAEWRLRPFDRIFSAPSLEGALGRMREYWSLLGAAHPGDEVVRAQLDELWRACEEAMTDARSGRLQAKRTS